MIPRFPPTVATVTILSEGAPPDPSPILRDAPFLSAAGSVPGMVVLRAEIGDPSAQDGVINAVSRFNLSSPPGVSAGLYLSVSPRYRDHLSATVLPYLAKIRGEVGGGVCPKDVRECPDGSYVTRQPPGCSFPPCPPPRGYDYGYGYGSARETVLVEVAR